MRVLARLLPVLCVVGVAVVMPDRATAWGTEAHHTVTRRALAALPQPLRDFLTADRDFVVLHSIDPDLWRTMDLSGRFGPEGPNHYFDIDGLNEPRPFSRVPRERRAFLARYGQDRAERTGRLPWQAADVYASLVSAFRDAGRRTSGAVPMNARYRAAVLAHYVEDAHVPFHAVVNHDGQLSGQRGIHARFESDLVRRYGHAVALEPVRITEVNDITAFLFDTIVESEGLAAPVLEADRNARGARTGYDDGYFERFFQGARSVLEARLGRAASSVASVLVAAWREAGEPRFVGGRGRA